jgi:hypothetical protein
MNFKKFFKLDNLYTKDDLKKAYKEKIKEIDLFDIPKIDKTVYKHVIYDLYLDGYKNIKDSNKKMINNIQSNSYSYSEASTKYLNPDGSITYIKDVIENKNGKIKNEHIGYKKYKNGLIESID